jgi:predicted ATP-dependent serine protease
MSRPNPVTREISPCKDCADRHEACWGKCEKYKTWKSRLDEVNTRRKEYNNKPFVQYNPFDY